MLLGEVPRAVVDLRAGLNHSSGRMGPADCTADGTEARHRGYVQLFVDERRADGVGAQMGEREVLLDAARAPPVGATRERAQRECGLRRPTTRCNFEEHESDAAAALDVR